MTRYERSWPCATCRQPVIYDDQAQTVNCDCGTWHAHSVNLQDYYKLPENPQQTLLLH